MVKERVILGIDPGTIVMGYGVLLVLNNKPYLQTMGVLQLNKYEDHYLRKSLSGYWGLLISIIRMSWLLKLLSLGKTYRVC